MLREADWTYKLRRYQKILNGIIKDDTPPTPLWRGRANTAQTRGQTEKLELSTKGVSKVDGKPEVWFHSEWEKTVDNY